MTTFEYVSSGVTSSGLVVGARHDLVVLNGGQADNVIVRYLGSETVSRGGVASGTVLEGAGTQVVRGSAYDTVVRSGTNSQGQLIVGEQFVSRGGSVTSTTLIGGWGEVDAGGVAADVRVSGGGRLADFGVTSHTVIEGPPGWSSYQGVFKGASAFDVTLLSGGKLEVNAGSASGVAVRSGGVAIDELRGVVEDVRVLSGGVLSLTLSGSASGTIVFGGGVELVDRSVESGGTLKGLAGPGLATSSSIGSGVGLLIDGASPGHDGVTSGEIVAGGGYEDVRSRGKAYHTVVRDGGVLEADDGSVVRGAVVNSGADLLIYGSAGQVLNTHLNAGALIDLGDVAATGATITGADLVVTSGSTALESFSLAGDVSGLAVTAQSDGHGGTLLTVTASQGEGHGLRSAAAAFGPQAPGGLVAAPAREDAADLLPLADGARITRRA